MVLGWGRRIIIVIANFIKINQKIEVRLPGQDEHYTTRIEDILENSLVIAMPMSKGLPIMVSRGSMLYCKVVTNGSVYQFTSSLMEKKLNPIPVWLISLPHQVKKIQQRSFVRINARISVCIEVFNSEKNDEPDLTLNLYTRDISGGGIQVVSKSLVAVGTIVRVHLDIPEQGVVILNGQVVRIEQPKADQNIFWVGIKFLDISECVRSRIIKFIFKRQLEQRQRGL